jgi:hypothetical protein
MHNHGNVDPHDAGRAADALLLAVHVDRDHSIGLCGGYSEDGKTIYVDHNVDTEFTLNGKKVEVIKYLVVHECVEKALMDNYDLDYAQAHALATGAEDAVVASDFGPDAVKEYGKQWAKQIGKITSARKDNPAPPDDLDMRPYEGAADKMSMPQEHGVLALLARRKPMRAVAQAAPDEPDDPTQPDEPDPDE